LRYLQAGRPGGTEYFDDAVYLRRMRQVTFAVVSLFPEGNLGDDWCAALLNIFEFGAVESIAETVPPPQPQFGGIDG
jgi:hypothetical protein